MTFGTLDAASPTIDAPKMWSCCVVYRYITVVKVYYYNYLRKNLVLYLKDIKNVKFIFPYHAIIMPENVPLTIDGRDGFVCIHASIVQLSRIFNRYA